jgi:hypothetical protein
MDGDPIGTTIRGERRQARLGDGPHVCILCGCSDPVALIDKTPDWLKHHGIPKTLFEQHHPAGRHHDPELTVLICRNCHAVATEGHLQAGVSMRPEPNPFLRVARKLDAEAVFLEELAAANRRSAELLRNSLRGRNRE